MYACAYGFFIGKNSNNSIEGIKKLNPINCIKEKNKKKELQENAKAEMNYWSDVFENLENYDGTPESQKEVRTIGR